MILVLFGLLAGVSALASELPSAAAWLLALAATLHGWRLASLELRYVPRGLLIDASGRVFVDGAQVSGFKTSWRGPLAFVHWFENGVRHQRTLLPDTLARNGRRELRLAMRRVSDASTVAMAP